MSATAHSETAPRPASLRSRARADRGFRVPSGRTREGRELLAFRKTLIEHVGGTPSAAQKVLIDRATMLQMHLNRLDELAASAGGSLSEHSTKVYLAWTGAMGRTMRLLGLKATPKAAPSLKDIDWGAVAREREAAAA
jgi:hypothetical protein